MKRFSGQGDEEEAALYSTMIGAMKRKASLSIPPESHPPPGVYIDHHHSSHSPQSHPMNCHEAYLSPPSSSGGSGGSGGSGSLGIGAPGGVCSGGSGGGGTHGPKAEKRIRWDGPRTQSLIEFYKINDFLWNAKLADYKNDKKRTQCLEAWLDQNHLEKELVNEVKMKLHGLRTSFGHQLKLESSYSNEGEKDEGPNFQSKWQWYNQLSFLKETMLCRTTSANTHSPTDSPPPSNSNHDHGHSSMQVGHSHHGTSLIHNIHEDMDIKMEMNVPINMQVAHSMNTHYTQPHELQEYIQPHHQSQPHNLSAASASGLPLALSNHEPLIASVTHSRKEEDDPMSYHHGRITATPPMAHMNSTSHNIQSTVSVSHQGELSRYHNNHGRASPNCCPCACSERPKSALGEKLGRLVEETFNNLHPEYQEMARVEIQQVLGKYLQKPVP